MSKARSRLIDYKSREFRTFHGFTTEVHFGKQAKHLPNQPNHDPSKSTITIGIRRIQELVEQNAGTGRRVSANKEVVDFGEIIGVYRSPKTGVTVMTTRGTIHYSKTGAHVVPADPNPPNRRKQ